MIASLEKAKNELKWFRNFTIVQIPRDQNSVADALARLASSLELESSDCVPIKFVPTPNTTPSDQMVSHINQ